MPHIRRLSAEPIGIGQMPGTYVVEDEVPPPGITSEAFQRYLRMPMEVRDYVHKYLATFHEMGMTIDEASTTRMMDAAEANFEAEYGMPAPQVDWRPPSRSHDEVVYYLQFGDLVKIGWTANLHLRMSQLPHDKLLAVEWGGRKVEAGRHAQFGTFRRKGEWFRLVPAIREHAERIRRRFEEDVAIDTESWAQHLLAKRSRDRLT